MRVRIVLLAADGMANQEIADPMAPGHDELRTHDFVRGVGGRDRGGHPICKVRHRHQEFWFDLQAAAHSHSRDRA